MKNKNKSITLYTLMRNTKVPSYKEEKYRVMVVKQNVGITLGVTTLKVNLSKQSKNSFD